MRFSGASRNNPNHLLAVFLKPHVDDQKNCSRTNGSESHPAFFFIRGFVSLRKRVGVIENKNGGLKANVMPEQISLVLVFIPFEAHQDRPAQFLG